MTQPTTNPFRTLLAGLSSTEPQAVTIQLLDWVTDIVNEPSEVVQTYGEAFQVLQFLETAGVLEIAQVPGTKTYTVKKL